MQVLSETQEFTSFCDFMSVEAEIVCNPISSFYALHASEANKEKHHSKVNKDKAYVFYTKIVTEHENSRHTRKVIKPCTFCQGSEHKIHNYSKFTAKSLEGQRQYIKDIKMCYGHSCNTCKGRHPTYLHDDSFIRKVKSAAVKMSLGEKSGCPSDTTSMIVPVLLSSPGLLGE